MTSPYDGVVYIHYKVPACVMKSVLFIWKETRGRATPQLIPSYPLKPAANMSYRNELMGAPRSALPVSPESFIGEQSEGES